MHKTNSAVVEQYAFHCANIHFIFPPVNRVPPSSETDSEQEGFLYHAVVPRRITTCKKFESVFLEAQPADMVLSVILDGLTRQRASFEASPLSGNLAAE